MKTIEEQIREMVDARADGKRELNERLKREIQSIKRREPFLVIFSSVPVRAAAACIIAWLGFLAYQHVSSHGDTPVCPHWVEADQPETSPYVASEDNPVLNTEFHHRVCYCSPRYSGARR